MKIKRVIADGKVLPRGKGWYIRKDGCLQLRKAAKEVKIEFIFHKEV